MVLILPIKKKHPNHTEHVKIDLSKMIGGLFAPPPQSSVFYQNSWFEKLRILVMICHDFNPS